MSKTITSFDTARHHIHIEFFVIDALGTKRSFEGIIDTGAPRTEFSDTFLRYAGFVVETDKEVSLKSGLQTQKYSKIVLPSIEICNHYIENFEVLVSRFEKSWGIAAIIGLDFFRRFRVTIDYYQGQIITESY